MGKILKSIHFILFVGLVAVICQILYSWIGFNPTDEGFVLSGARRILDGQFTHKDFLSLRPGGSSYLHMLVVKYGGESTFYLSRFIFWIQSAIIAWIWITIANKLMKLELNIVYRYLLALAVFIFNVHSFPPMAWTTIDGLFLSTLGVWFITHFGKNGNQIGYILIGCAALCKQNFLILIPGIFIILGHWKRPYYILVGLVPAMIYGFFIWKFDLISDSLAQIFARNELIETGIMAYIKSPPFFVGLAIPICINIFRNRYQSFLKNIDFILGFALLIIGAASLYLNVFIGSFSFALFGFAIGYMVVHVKSRGKVLFSSLTILMGWAVSISLGYNTPALASGLLITTILTLNYNRKLFPMKTNHKYLASLGFAVVLLFAFHFTRITHVYKDNKASELTADLGIALYGAKNIKTNKLNQKIFLELDSLANQYHDSLAIIPDYSAFWVTSKYPNPLNIDWPNQGETQSAYFQDSIEANLLDQKGSIIIAVQKYRASEVFLGKRPLEDETIQFPIVTMVQTHFLKIEETEYFNIYK